MTTFMQIELYCLWYAETSIVLSGSLAGLDHERPPGYAVRLSCLDLQRARADQRGEILVMELC